MTRIHIARDRRPLGNFSPHEVADGLKSGRFLPTDLAWQEPMESWKLLGEFTDLPEPEIEEVELPPPPPPPAVPGQPSLVSGEAEPAWERRAELGFFPALAETIRQVFSEPVRTFRAMRQTGGTTTPLNYYLILALLGTWATMIYNLVVIKISPELMANQMPKNVTESAMIGYQIASMVIAPFMVALNVFISAGLFHLVLIALAGTEKKFETTFRATCYATGTIAVLMLVPICGSYLFIIFGTIYMVIALREAHGISTAQAVGSVIIPTVCCCTLLLGGYTLLYTASGSLK